MLPQAAEAECAKLGDLPVKLKACLIELLSYQCKFESGESAWQLLKALQTVAYPSLLDPADAAPA